MVSVVVHGRSRTNFGAATPRPSHADILKAGSISRADAPPPPAPQRHVRDGLSMAHLDGAAEFDLAQGQRERHGGQHPVHTPAPSSRLARADGVTPRFCAR
jgi:hypothetical protein